MHEVVGFGLERQADVDAERALPPGPAVAGFHDPRPGTGDDHPAAIVRHLLGELRRQHVVGVLGRRPCRAEDGHLGGGPVAVEHQEGVAHLLEGAVGQLQVGARGVVLQHLQPADQHLPDQIDVVVAVVLAV